MEEIHMVFHADSISAGSGGEIIGNKRWKRLFLLLNEIGNGRSDS